MGEVLTPSPRKPGEVEEHRLERIHRNDAPAVVEPVDARQRQRIDHETQRVVWRKIERDGEHGADGAGMHDEDRLARWQQRKTGASARDLVDETFAAGRPVAGGRFPEFAIGAAELAFQLIVTPSRPRAEILFAKRRLFRRNEAQPLAPSPAFGAQGCTPLMRLPATVP